ncbi:DNA polymerase [Danaus plexippus plexippus]|uniref:DNA polymerase epsilon catalytic subunit n=1 Tax=Danaus plexippus plexippus TaxID=278856 RepID=A0A212FLJ3_DANPL|nr:DNA polymerase [Danaus plexippus plexippus]
MVLQNTGKYRTDKNDSNKKDPGTSSAPREESSESRLRNALDNDKIDSKYGFDRVRDTKERTGYLINMHTAEILDEDKRLVAAVDYYFIEMDGSRFKVSLVFQPYFLVLARKECEQEVIQYLSKKFAGTIHKIEVVEKEDLDLPNHLSGIKQRYIKLSFMSQNEMMKVRKELLTAANKSKEREKKDAIYSEMLTNVLTNAAAIEHAKKTTDHLENIIDIREHDVPYHIRVSIDMKIFCGTWYTVKSRGNDTPIFTKRDDILERPDPIVLAFDIETTKLPLKFPDSQTDQIMMISYMIDAQGYLITNREIISTDVEDFEYTPKPEFEGQFIVFNEPNELALIQKFFDHIMDIKPHIFVTYNGDFFDWPFVEARAAALGLDMRQEIGFSRLTRDGTYACRPAMHMDCLCWVKRDSYLPVGSQGLKAVAKAKLRYDPVELDPEDMCRMASEQPQVLSNYSVSDAVATYYLYMKYVQPFIFALCTIIPLEPDEVLRKGSGTLCESLLMVEAFHANIVFPNKQVDELNKLTSDGHVLETETYVGGHVEALESGVFRADIKCKFRIVPSAVEKLIENIEKTMKHAIEVEEAVPLELVTNFDEVCSEIREKLQHMKDHPRRDENPLIYHLDVGAMYPNIILTNRLQPSAMVSASACAACDHNRPGARCQRRMDWTWRGDYLPATRSEYQRIQQQLETEKFPPLHPGGPNIYEYTLHLPYIIMDRRYEYKALNKQAKALVAEAVRAGDAADIKNARSREVLYDSLQLAHKCILNSFYGYVMRRGARWHSMEMAGIVCHTGANIIMRAREIIEQVGRPLELDTDGIWCILPSSFPENVTINTTHHKKKKINVSYPNAVLNAMVKDYFTNDQYYELVDPVEKKYEVRSENSIFFEVDGPYLAMVLPASKEEGKKLKKRYAVFNFDGSLAELKGFEVKRRGELQLIKIFQSSVFEAFLKGNDLKSCYGAVAKVADYWLDVLYSKGSNMPDSELFELISENRSMSKKLEDYGGQKSTSISTAKRLAEFLGDEMLDNPVPRVQYPDWLHKKILAKTDKYKTRKITEMFTSKPKEIRNCEDADAACESTEVDIEDIGKECTAKPIQPVAHRVKRKREPSPRRASSWREALGPPPSFGDTKEQRTAWIVFQKKKWMWQMEQRGVRDRNKRGKVDSDVSLMSKSLGPANTLGGFIKRAQRTLLNTPWQVIQIQETAEPGVFRVWSLVGSELHQLKLTVPRQFYVNRRVPLTCDTGPHWRRVSRVLPRSRPAHHLYLYTVPEALYRERCQELMSELSAPEIEGIYETQMSLEFRALVTIGCVCVVDPQEARRLIQFGSNNMDSFNLSQLQFKSVAHQPYLQKQDEVSPIKHIFLYQHSSPNSSRSMWSLVLAPIKKGYIFVLDTVKTNQVPNMNTLYNAERTAKINLGTDEKSLPNADLSWEVVVETEPRAVYRGVQRALQRYRDERCGPTMVALQTTLSSHALLALMPGLSEFPLVPLHVRDVETLYNTLEWQRIGARAIVRHYLNLDSVLELTIEQCRYFHLPLGNTSSDPTQFGADVFFARHLLKHNFVLWCSGSERPDLGGREIDDNRLVSESDEWSSCRVCSRGSYGGVCVALTGDALAVSALLQAHTILQTEGTSVATSFGAQHANIQDVMASTGSNATETYDETAQCSAAFKILRTMVASWLRDVTHYKNVFADFQISHFYRWLKSPTSLLYDPALRRTLYSLMKKLFLMLVAEFRRLGSQIIYADFNKIILYTKKHSLMDGIGYVEFVVQSIRNKELFHGIDIRYKQCWTYLLWLDEANYAGIEGKLPAGLVEVGSSQIPDNTDVEEEGEITMEWNISRFMPGITRESFVSCVAGFLSAAHADSGTLKAMLAGEMTQKFFQLAEKINRRMPTLSLEDIGPQAGLREESLEGATPALLFVNALCHVLGLDTNLEDEVTLLRRNLLRLLSVGEFSSLAEWRDPCASCVLAELSCRVCNHSQDLDLCRTQHHDNEQPVCLCPTCGTAYDNQELEWKLIETMNRRAMSYTLQDLICTRCHQVKRENLSTVCDCAGEFTTMVSLKEIRTQLMTYKTIAEYYKMPLLMELIAYNLSNM